MIKQRHLKRFSKASVEAVSFAVIFVSSRNASPGEKRCVTTQKTAAKETWAMFTRHGRIFYRFKIRVLRGSVHRENLDA